MKIADLLSEDDLKLAKKEAQPSWIDPALAKLTKEYFSDPAWIFERKLDGVRCIVYRKGTNVRLMSRNKKKMNDTYPELVEALKKQPLDFIADTEIVTFDKHVTSFSRLQERMNVVEPEEALIRRVPVFLYFFDLMHVIGYNITELPLRSRKRALRSALSFKDPLRFCMHRNEYGKKFLQEACRKGWEGLIAKNANEPYAHKRTGNWLKFKCIHRQELVIGGYTDPAGSREGFGAILVGYYESDNLQYAGKIGTGFSDQLLSELHQKMVDIERDHSPFHGAIKEKGIHWIKPELVAEVGFTEWTSDNKLRHPRFLGLRTDKSAKDVVKET